MKIIFLVLALKLLEIAKFKYHSTIQFAIYCTLAFMKKIVCLILFFTIGTVFCQGHKTTITKLNSFPIEADVYIGFDGLGNNYFIKNDVFTKQNEHQIFEYKNISLGKISFVDIINPLKIMLFYENFNSVVTLDNQLNEIQKINFSEIDNSMVISKIGMALKNQFWIYNAINQKISLFDYLKNNYQTIGNPIPENIKYSQSNFNNFYWIDEVNNWYSCDIFGKVLLLASIPPFDKIQIFDNEKLLFSIDDKMYFLDNKTKALIKIEIFEKSFQNFHYKDQILAIFTNQQITNYKIKLP